MFTIRQGGGSRFCVEEGTKVGTRRASAAAVLHPKPKTSEEAAASQSFQKSHFKTYA